MRLIGIAVLAIAAGCGGSGERHPANAAAAPVNVQVMTVAPTRDAATSEAGGLVAARMTAVVASRVLAPITAVLVRPGDHVRAGQTLVRLDVAALSADADRGRTAAAAAADGVRAADAERAAAEAAMTLADATYTRISGLQSRGSATRQELDESTASRAAARARLDAAIARQAEAASAASGATAASRAATVWAGYGEVVAPFEGTVVEKLADPGTLASPGMPLVRVEDTRAFTLDVRADASRAVGVRVGQHVPVAIDQVGPLDGTVIEVAHAVDADDRSVLVRIELPAQAALRSGLFGRARFSEGERSAIRVPEAAIRRNGQLASVFVADEGRARLRLIRAGAPLNGLAEVQSGLVAGEHLILDPPAMLTDGQPVTGGGR